MRWLPLPLLIVLVACGSSPTSPTPLPPAAVTITGSITDTVTGAPVGTFTHQAGSLPAFVAVSAPGYITRGAWIASATPTVDLIPEAGFDLGFYRQFARGALEGRTDALRVLSVSPRLYLQTAGLKPSTVDAYEAAARATVPALTGGKLQIVAVERGEDRRTPTAGWITMELVSDPAATCGRATLGASAGQVWINTDPVCHRNGDIVSTPALFAHEIGHALGFSHIDRPGLLANPVAADAAPSALERHHGAIAYKRSAGNLDVDTDTQSSAISSLTRIVVD